MYACVASFDLRLPHPGSLKDKRSVITPILDGARRRHRVAVAETDHQDDHHRSRLAFATVGATEHQARAVLDAVDRFVWSFPEIEVTDSTRHWIEVE